MPGKMNNSAQIIIQGSVLTELFRLSRKGLTAPGILTWLKPRFFIWLVFRWETYSHAGCHELIWVEADQQTKLMQECNRHPLKANHSDRSLHQKEVTKPITEAWLNGSKSYRLEERWGINHAETHHATSSATWSWQECLIYYFLEITVAYVLGKSGLARS